MLLTTLSILGLLEVGDTISDPFGRDPEDFAVLHFVECTAVASLEAIQVDSMVPRHKTEFYSNTELRAAIAVATRMVYRFRARKKLRQAREEEAAAAAAAARAAGGRKASGPPPLQLRQGERQSRARSCPQLPGCASSARWVTARVRVRRR